MRDEAVERKRERERERGGRRRFGLKKKQPKLTHSPPKWLPQLPVIPGREEQREGGNKETESARESLKRNGGGGLGLGGSEAVKKEEGQQQALLNWQAAARKLIALFPSEW